MHATWSGVSPLLFLFVRALLGDENDELGLDDTPDPVNDLLFLPMMLGPGLDSGVCGASSSSSMFPLELDCALVLLFFPCVLGLRLGLVLFEFVVVFPALLLLAFSDFLDILAEVGFDCGLLLDDVSLFPAGDFSVSFSFSDCFILAFCLFACLLCFESVPFEVEFASSTTIPLSSEGWGVSVDSCSLP